MRSSHQSLTFGRTIGPHPLEELSRLGLYDNGMAMSIGEKSLTDRMIQKISQTVEVSLDIQNS